VEDIPCLKGLSPEEIITWGAKIENAIKFAKNAISCISNSNSKKDSPNHNSNSICTHFHRVDGILLINFDKLIILTEFYIFDYSLSKNEFVLTRSIMISTIDFITLARDGNEIILHLIPSILNKTNYRVKYKNLEKVACCLSSTYLYDNPDLKNRGSREVSVITINNKFNLFDELEKICEYSKYCHYLNNFIEKTLSQSKLPEVDFDDLAFQYKYCAVKYRVNNNNDEKKTSTYTNNTNININVNSTSINTNTIDTIDFFENADLIVTRRDIYILKYTSLVFKLTYHIQMGNLKKLTNKNGASSFFIYDKKVVPNGLEIFTESCMSLLTLIDDLYQDCVNKSTIVGESTWRMKK
jgi:hypothetical protein